jgi:hypothetical protein
MAFGPDAGLELVDALVADGALAAYHLLPAVRGDLLAKLGRGDEARQPADFAIELGAVEPMARDAPRGIGALPTSRTGHAGAVRAPRPGPAPPSWSRSPARSNSASSTWAPSRAGPITSAPAS